MEGENERKQKNLAFYLSTCATSVAAGDKVQGYKWHSDCNGQEDMSFGSKC